MSILSIFFLFLAAWFVGGIIILVSDFYTTAYLFYDYERTLSVGDILVAGALGFLFLGCYWVSQYIKNAKPFAWIPDLSPLWCFVIFKRSSKWKANPESAGSL